MASNPLAPPWLRVPDDANALVPGLWSRTVRRRDGAIEVGGVSVADHADRFGTPLYVVDEHEARERAVEVRSALQRAFAEVGSAAKVYYAGKAFLSIEVARWMAEAGLNIDVSPREGFPFPFTKFVPWAAYARLRDGRSFLLEQEQLAETLRGMPGDNPDCLSFDGTIEQMTAAPEIRIPIG